MTTRVGALNLCSRAFPLRHLWEEEMRQKVQGNSLSEFGAHARIRTGDLFLTKEMLYRLSYVGGATASEF